MSVLEAIVLGVVQGLTEFLPVSSSAHLIVVPWLFGWDEPGLSFDGALHLGTLVGVLAYFWRDYLGMALALPRALARPVAVLRGRPSDPSGRAGQGDLQARLALLIALGTVPGLIAGAVGQDAIDGFFHGDDHRRRAVALIAVALALVGVLLWIADRVSSRARTIGDITWRDAIVLGFAQAAALFPGVSRSGATMTVGLFRGLDRSDAARFSFLLGTPLILAAGVKGVLDALQAGMVGHEGRQFAAGTAVSAMVGVVSIWALLRLLRRSSLAAFVLYRVGFGALLLTLIAMGFR